MRRRSERHPRAEAAVIVVGALLCAAALLALWLVAAAVPMHALPPSTPGPVPNLVPWPSSEYEPLPSDSPDGRGPTPPPSAAPSPSPHPTPRATPRPSPHASAAPRPPSGPAPRPVSPRGAARISGLASWYCRPGVSVCPVGWSPYGMYAAACAPLRAAMGPSWRGRTVWVQGIAVRLVDYCASTSKTIDLFWSVMSRLGGTGVLRVAVRW